MKGWISLHRKIQDSRMWTSERFTKGQAWVDLILMANHKDNVSIKGMRAVKIKRGQILTSQRKLAKRWRWNKKTVKAFLNLLESEEMIHHKTDRNIQHGYTLIELLNYDQYQPTTPQSIPQRTPQGDRNVPTNNNVNNVNKIKQVSDETFSFKEKMDSMRRSKDKRMKIIALYWKKKNWWFENEKQYEAALKRELRPAGRLVGYTGDDIATAIKYCEDKYQDIGWTLETVGKRITDLVNTK